jgi:AraC-like DNA-binding protein
MGYRELPPPARVRDSLACLWIRVVPREGALPTRIVPDACVDLVWESGRGAFVAGPDTCAKLTRPRPGAVVVGARFLPGAGGPALRVGLDALRDQRLDAAELWPALAVRLPGDLSPAAALRGVTETAVRLTTAAPPDLAVREAARRLARPRARVEELADDLGLSRRQLRRRCHAAVGYGPKTLQRVLRLRRFLAGLEAAGPEPVLARLAAEAGYADQAHLTRECGELAGLSPATLARRR